MAPTSVHFNGSVNLPDAETVMREISARVPSAVRRMTEGETGDRNYWTWFQYHKFAAMPEFEGVLDATPTGTPSVDAGVDTRRDVERLPQLRLAAGADPTAFRWPDIGYAAAYVGSFATFRRLRDAGTIPPGVRMQMQYPTPLAGLGMVAPEDARRLMPSYEDAMFADLDRALVTLPHGEVAVQWDVANETILLAGGFGGRPVTLDAVVPGLARCLDRVPADVPAGVHLCYGDYLHRHFVEPESLALQVGLANALAGATGRTIDWISFTVPQDRADAAYFAPLRDLVTGAATELSFGIVPYHPDRQPAGTTAAQIRHIDAALAGSPAGARGWAVSTECGMGRVDRADVPALLDLHREILAGHPRM